MCVYFSALAVMCTCDACTWLLVNTLGICVHVATKTLVSADGFQDCTKDVNRS